MILVVWPYDSNSLNYVSLYNEMAVSGYLYILFQLTDYLDTMSATTNTDYSHTKEILSWILTSILMLTIFINFIYTLFHLSVRLFAYCRRIRERNTEELRQLMEQTRRKKYKQPVMSVDATRLEGDLIVEDLTLSQNNLIQVKKKDKVSIKDFPDMFTI
jgi:hypothetical protein